MGDQIDNSPMVSNPNISALLWGGYPGWRCCFVRHHNVQGYTSWQIANDAIPPSSYISHVLMTDMSLRPNATSSSLSPTYQWYTDEAVFDFDLGLHYTNFSSSLASSSTNAYGSLSNKSCNIASPLSDCNEAYFDRCAFQTCSVKLKNTGRVTSGFVTFGFLAVQHDPQPCRKDYRLPTSVCTT
jgi:xylan 1,4-beta-xylosidase